MFGIDLSQPEWGEWSEFSACTQTCGTGVTMRNRTCQITENESGHCVGKSEEMQLCNQQECKQIGKLFKLNNEYIISIKLYFQKR